MQLNSIVFAAPKCSYSTNSLLKDLIYVPRCPSRWIYRPDASPRGFPSPQESANSYRSFFKVG